MTAHGILVANKPRGSTSHDLVQQARRLFGTRAVGHAGTLDPMASGVLLLLFGEATKLAAFLTASDKEYRAEVTFGYATDTLDADGNTVEEMTLAEDWLDEARLAAAVEKERERVLQVPPAFSAISIRGERAYRRARRGEHVALEPRSVRVSHLELVGRRETALRFAVSVSKGYYVRAFARDLGESLGVPAHLSELIRVASGPFVIDEAVPWPPPERPPLVPVSEAARRGLPPRILTPSGARRAVLGQKLEGGDFLGALPSEGISAWFGPDGRLVALGNRHPDGSFRIKRGFRIDV